MYNPFITYYPLDGVPVDRYTRLIKAGYLNTLEGKLRRCTSKPRNLNRPPHSSKDSGILSMSVPAIIVGGAVLTVDGLVSKIGGTLSLGFGLLGTYFGIKEKEQK